LIKVISVDDHPVVRKGIKNILSLDDELSLTGEASSCEELFGLLKKDPCDIILLDISIKGKNGLDTLIEIKHHYPEIKVIILSMHVDEDIIKRAFKTGASGYVGKESIPEELVKSVKAVYGGSKYLGSTLISKINRETYNIISGRKNLTDLLSDKEYQILCLIASGNSNDEIAKMLSINVKTISSYKSRIHEKIGIKTDSEFAIYGLKNRFILLK
jgi:two-component system, NarL family, invasion response regulator UvrY